MVKRHWLGVSARGCLKSRSVPAPTVTPCSRPPSSSNARATETSSYRPFSLRYMSGSIAFVKLLSSIVAPWSVRYCIISLVPPRKFFQSTMVNLSRFESLLRSSTDSMLVFPRRPNECMSRLLAPWTVGGWRRNQDAQSRFCLLAQSR